jgi:hypothetical protein
MPPGALSRYTFAEGLEDSEGRLFLAMPEPYRYRDLPDNIRHEVSDGDTLEGLAGRYYGQFGRGCLLWWVIADFQPDPIHDPTIALEAGRVLIIPSPRTVEEEILAEKRRADAVG